jgi:hypothetical protein
LEKERVQEVWTVVMAVAVAVVEVGVVDEGEKARTEEEAIAIAIAALRWQHRQCLGSSIFPLRLEQEEEKMV